MFLRTKAHGVIALDRAPGQSGQWRERKPVMVC